MTTGDRLRLGSLAQVAQPATELARSVAFYRDTLGLPLLAQFDPPGLAFFDLDGVRLMLSAIAEEASDHPGSPLYFAVDDIDCAYRDLQVRGVTFDGEPHLIHTDDGTLGHAGVQEWMAFFRDPDGNILAIISRVTP